MRMKFLTFYFMFMNSIIRSVERRNFEVVTQDGRFDVMCKGSIYSSGSSAILILLKLFFNHTK